MELKEWEKLKTIGSSVQSVQSVFIYACVHVCDVGTETANKYSIMHFSLTIWMHTLMRLLVDCNYHISTYKADKISNRTARHSERQ